MLVRNFGLLCKKRDHGGWTWILRGQPLTMNCGVSVWMTVCLKPQQKCCVSNHFVFCSDSAGFQLSSDVADDSQSEHHLSDGLQPASQDCEMADLHVSQDFQRSISPSKNVRLFFFVCLQKPIRVCHSTNL